MNKTIFIILACDTDPDRSYFVSDLAPDKLSWRGMLEGITEAKTAVSKIIDSNNKSPIFTWLLRADEQIKHYYGSHNYILKSNQDFFLNLEKSGDELGWHPHFWYFDNGRKKWHQNWLDFRWQTKMLEESYSEYQEILPGRGRVVRMGWSYHNIHTMNKISDLGVRFDLSAIPAFKIDPNESKYDANYYDWAITKRRPYNPSVNDYRRSSVNFEEELPLVEIPNFVSRSRIWSLLGGVILAKKMKDYTQITRAIASRSYYATITVRPILFRPILKQILKDTKKYNKVFFVTGFHPDELLKNIHPMYSLRNLIVNLTNIIDHSNIANIPIVFSKPSDLEKIVLDKNENT